MPAVARAAAAALAACLLASCAGPANRGVPRLRVAENGGHGSARAAPIAGQLMKLYLDTEGK